MTFAMKNRHLAQIIHDERERQNLTQEHLAQLADVSTRTIQRLETDGSHSKETLMAVAEAIGVDCKAILELARNRAATDASESDEEQQQLDELEAKKKEIKRQKSILKLEKEVLDELSNLWSELVPGFYLNEQGFRMLRKLRIEFEIHEITEAMQIATASYLQLSESKPTHESVENAWRKVGGVCRLRRLEKTQPGVGRIYYIRGILRNRFSYINEGLAIGLLREAVEWNIDITGLENFTKTTSSWSAWRTAMEDFISGQKAKKSQEAAAN